MADLTDLERRTAHLEALRADPGAADRTTFCSAADELAALERETRDFAAAHGAAAVAGLEARLADLRACAASCCPLTTLRRIRSGEVAPCPPRVAAASSAASLQPPVGWDEALRDAAHTPRGGGVDPLASDDEGEAPDALVEEVPSSSSSSSEEDEPAAPVEPVEPGTEAEAEAESSGHALFSWGRGDTGQLLRPEQEGEDDEEEVPRLRNRPLAALAASQFHSLVATAQGEVFAGGANDEGQTCGEGPAHTRLRKVEPLLSHRVTAVACGALHSLCVTDGGLVLTFGDNEFGQLGRGGSGREPRMVQGLQGRAAVAVAAGDRHSLVLTAKGRVLAFGSGAALGLGAERLRADSATLVAGLLATPVVALAAGEQHSVAVSAAGSAYAWGRNFHGCLGVNVAPAPRGTYAEPLPALMRCDGVAVRAAACGAGHTLLLGAARGQVLACGRGAQGQLGDARSTASRACPTPVPGVEGAVQVAAAGVASYCVLASGEVRAWGGGAVAAAAGEGARGTLLACGAEHVLVATGAAADAAAADPPRAAAIQTVTVADLRQRLDAGKLSSPMTLNASFADPETAFMDHEAVEAAWRVAVTAHGPAAAGEAVAAVTDAVRKLRRAAPQLTTRDGVRALLVAWQCPLLARAVDLWEQLAAALTSLPPGAIHAVFRDQIRRVPPHIFASRFVAPAVAALDREATDGATSPRLLRTVQLLRLLHATNQADALVPAAAFYAAHLAALDDRALLERYVQWKRLGANAQVVAARSYVPCAMPFLLSAETKRRLVQLEATVEMQQLAMAGALLAPHPFLVLQVRREHLLRDTLAQVGEVAKRAPVALKRQLKVVFAGEEGVDAGGVKREFFGLLIDALMSPEYGMFTVSPETRQMWFSRYGLDSASEYRLVGVLIGLAIHNGVILDLHLASPVFKLLLGQTLGLADLAKVDPALASGLQQLLDYEPDDVEDVFGMTFEVAYEFLGATRTHCLVEGGAELAVTQANKHDFVARYVAWLLHESVAVQQDAFVAGFRLVVLADGAVALCSPAELELLVVGTPHLDFAALEAAAVYEGGFAPEARAVRWFWQWVHSLDIDMGRKLLQFVTGTAKAPIGGLGNVVVKLQRAGPSSNALPTSHTCFATLLLPDYESYELLAERCGRAVEECEGFGLQ